MPTPTKQTSHTIVLTTPSGEDNYYDDVFNEIIDFQSRYVQKIQENSGEAFVLTDPNIKKDIEQYFPAGVLIDKPMADIWMRDFTLVNPTDPVQFRYTAAAQGGDQREADFVQSRFNSLAKKLGFGFRTTPLLLDGGNLVDNYKGKVIVTDRFLEDNNITKQEGKRKLRDVLGAEQVAIIPSDDSQGLAHADGMVMFIENDTIAINEYQEPFRSEVIDELKDSFTDINIVEIPADFDDEIWDERFSSACGIYVNSVVTDDSIYLPIFGSENDQVVIGILKENTSKKIVPVDASQVCKMGGSVRCLSLQVVGDNQKNLMNYSE